MIDHHLEIRFQENADKRVVAQVFTVRKWNDRAELLARPIESLRFASAPCKLKQDATQCALMYIREAWGGNDAYEKLKEERDTLRAQLNELQRDMVGTLKTLDSARADLDAQGSTVAQLRAENERLHEDSSRGIAMFIKLGNVKTVLETVLEHCEGKGWRSPDVAALVRSTIEMI